VCSALPPSHEIWTCDRCNKRSSLNRQSTGSTRPSLVRKSITNCQQNVQKEQVTVSTVSLFSEIVELKKMVTDLLSKVASMEENHRVEMRFLRNTNTDLLSKISDLQRKFPALPDRLLTSNGLSLGLRGSCSEAAQSKITSQFSPADSISVDLINCDEPSTSKSFERDVALCPGESLCETNELISSSSITRDSVDIKWISVSNLNPTTSVDDVKLFISKKLDLPMTAIGCYKITPKLIVNPRFAAFKISLPFNLLPKVKSQHFWPPEVLIKDFVIKNSNFRQTAKLNTTR
jgi:hypothetical protein